MIEEEEEIRLGEQNLNEMQNLVQFTRQSILLAPSVNAGHTRINA